MDSRARGRTLRGAPTELLTLKEASTRLRMGLTTLKAKVRHHEIEVTRDGRWVRVPDWALETWIRNHIE